MALNAVPSAKIDQLRVSEYPILRSGPTRLLDFWGPHPFLLYYSRTRGPRLPPTSAPARRRRASAPPPVSVGGMTISTRRFCASRTPSLVGTSGSASPLLIVVITAAGTPSRTSSALTASVRRSESARLYCGVPERSV